MKNPQAWVESRRSGGNRHVVDVIHRFVDAGIGIEVFAIFNADTLTIFHQAVTRKMTCTVEAHVFQEMGQSALIVFFQNGTHFLSDVEIGLTGRLSIVTNIIGQTII